ncbi:rod shape-determining protein MreC [Oceanicella actignis]|uniref:rod shape-determining protein MreC n=1 Tax=Oceanicella actignis TaxID=1189325 RepID=UPI0011E61FA0|nr:rod shape-determining protein MreC [Oceanicella actignis]TYO91650.1 rod shape-determining protein MreC [Oceanicella actignis]
MSDARIRHEDMARAARRAVAAALAVALFGVFVLWRADNPRLERLRMAAAEWLRPSLEWTATPARFVSDMIADYQRFTRVYAQNAELRREIQRLRAWREAARQLEQENARLRALNNVRLAPAAGFATGEIIADGGGPFLQTALVNVGARDGVRDGAAVMDGSGLVGRVTGVGRHVARVLFVTDHSSRVPVTLLPSGRRAIMAGDAGAAPLLAHVENPDQPVAGERIVTSGAGGVFPPDLPVGLAVIGPRGKPRALLSADMKRLEFVRVLRYEPDTRIDAPGGLILRPAPSGAPPAASEDAPDGGAGGAGPNPAPGAGAASGMDSGTVSGAGR